MQTWQCKFAAVAGHRHWTITAPDITDLCCLLQTGDQVNSFYILKSPTHPSNFIFLGPLVQKWMIRSTFQEIRCHHIAAGLGRPPFHQIWTSYLQTDRKLLTMEAFQYLSEWAGVHCKGLARPTHPSNKNFPSSRLPIQKDGRINWTQDDLTPRCRSSCNIAHHQYDNISAYIASRWCCDINSHQNPFISDQDMKF